MVFYGFSDENKGFGAWSNTRKGQGVWDKDIRMKASWWDMLGGLEKKKRKVGPKRTRLQPSPAG